MFFFFFTAKVVDLDPCLTKKPVEDSACHPYNTRGSMSEIQSLSSFQSESCDDNGKCHLRHVGLNEPFPIAFITSASRLTDLATMKFSEM